MSLAHKTAGSLAWVTIASAGARFLTIGSTFALTRFLQPEVQGEVNLAFVLVSTLGMATGLGASQFVAAHPRESRATVFHGSVLVLAAGLVACGASVACAGTVGRLLHVPGMTPYVPGLALAHYLDRCGWVPRSLLVREMRFRTLGLRVAAGELSFAVSSVALAALGFGGSSIVAGNIVRSGVGLAFVLAVTSARDHLTPSRLEAATFRRILAFGLPITISQFLRMGATTWDNSLMGSRFGSAIVGVYNQAYRLAELPATAFADPSNDVLVPTFARVSDRATRRVAFLRATALLTLMIAPMSAGLAVVASSLVGVFYPPAYRGVAPFVTALAILGLARSLLGLSNALLQVTGRTKSFITIDAGLVISVLGGIWALSRWGAVPAACGVGIGFVTSIALTLRALRPEGISGADMLGATLRPLAAAAPMVLAVLAARRGLDETHLRAGTRLAAEILVGAAIYTIAVSALAPDLVRDLRRLATSIIRRPAPTRAPPS
ncbi:MAG: oligosaccharide flippase family protein [Polyangiaceae bacterium]